MANTFLTIQLIAREALLRLRNNLVMRPLIHTNYSGDFKKLGDTIKVKKPAVYTANEFSATISLQNITENSLTVSLDHLTDVSVNWTSKERALNISQFGEQVLNPAMEAIAQKIDNDILSNLYKDIPYFIGTSGTTPSSLDDFANARKILNTNKAPMGNRSAVWNPDADAKFSTLASIVNAEKSGSTAALREGAIGRIQGLNNYMDQNIATHVAGTFTALATPLTAGATAVGAVNISMDGGAGVETIVAGDIFSIGIQQYVATGAAAAIAGAITVPVYPAVPSIIADNTAVVFVDKTAGGHVVNLAFHQNAFAFVQRPLEAPMGGATSYTTSFEGLSLRVTAGYDITTKKEIVSIDTLYGIKTLYPELAVRALG